LIIPLTSPKRDLTYGYFPPPFEKGGQGGFYLKDSLILNKRLTQRTCVLANH
jgi:hypothetical protein